MDSKKRKLTIDELEVMLNNPECPNIEFMPSGEIRVGGVYDTKTINKMVKNCTKITGIKAYSVKCVDCMGFAGISQQKDCALWCLECLKKYRKAFV